ncbi:MAG: hypothetical protein V3W34_08040 [Phycisphaerae bacterium]
MTRRTILAITLITVGSVGLFAAGGRGRAEQTVPETRPEFKPVMPVHDLMIEQERHFNRILELIRDEAVTDRFDKMRHEALALGEMANINGYQDRAHKQPEYRSFAADLERQCIELAELAVAKKIDEAKKLAVRVNGTCNACHKKFDSSP